MSLSPKPQGTLPSNSSGRVEVSNVTLECGIVSQLTQAKRLWEHSAYLAQRSIDVEKHLAVLQALKPIFGGWPAQLAQIAAHAETLRDMLSRRGPVVLWGTVGKVSGPEDKLAQRSAERRSMSEPLPQTCIL